MRPQDNAYYEKTLKRSGDTCKCPFCKKMNRAGPTTIKDNCKHYAGVTRAAGYARPRSTINFFEHATYNKFTFRKLKRVPK